MIITFAMLISSIPAGAITVDVENIHRIQLDSGKTIVFTKQQLDNIINISAKEAEKIALSFLNSTKNNNNNDWNDNTKIENVVTMYDNSDANTITAYNFNLTNGYIVISAYADVENIILEWSDQASPLYQQLDLDENDKVIYLGGYEYFADNGTEEVKDIYNNHVKKDDLSNLLEQERSIDNIPDSILENSYNSSASLFGFIDDSQEDANINYADIYDLQTQAGHLYNFVPFISVTDSYIGLNISDFGVALANVAYACEMYYELSLFIDPEDAFDKVIQYGVANHYYCPNSCTVCNHPSNRVHQVLASDEYAYAKGFFETYFPPNIVDIGFSTTTSSGIPAINGWEEISVLFSQFKGIFIHSLSGHSIYGTHRIVGIRAERYVGRTNGYPLTYIAVADGLTNHERFVTLASIMRNNNVQFLER